MTAPRRTPSKRALLTAILSAALTAVAVVILVTGEFGAQAPKEVTYSEILEVVETGTVTEAKLDDANLVVKVTDGDGTVSVSRYPVGAGKDLADEFTKQGINVEVDAPARTSLLTTALMTLLPVALIIGFLLMATKGGMLGGGGLPGMRLGKRGEAVEVPTVRFADVAGADEAVSELAEVVEFLNDPARFSSTGATVPRGFLLVGPPGTGKTLLARAVAGEAGVPFFAVSGSDFVQTFVGQGAARVRELFDKARAGGKAIVFIDEIDAVGKHRGRGHATGANDERENTLNQILVEMDGFARAEGLVVIAATNRADVLDPALLRPGRFDRHIMVPVPDRTGREKILRLYAKERPFDQDIDWAAVAKRIPGMSGAEIEQMLNEAALDAARHQESTVSSERVDNAIATTVLGRERRSAVITDRDREIVAWHESGHTVAALVLEHADDPVQVTIVPRGRAGGVTWMTGSDHDFITRKQALARLTVAMSGRAAEEILLDGDYTQGAHGDLQSATSLAKEMVARYGMGDKLISLTDDDLAFAEGTRVNEEVARLIGDAMSHARQLLIEHRSLLELIAYELLEQETLVRDDLGVLMDSLSATE